MIWWFSFNASEIAYIPLSVIEDCLMDEVVVWSDNCVILVSLDMKLAMKSISFVVILSPSNTISSFPNWNFFSEY